MIRRLWDRSVTDLKDGEDLPKPVSQLRESLSTMLTFFVSSSSAPCWTRGPVVEENVSLTPDWIPLEWGNRQRDAYANEFGFTTGPPLHDALTIIHLTHPHLLQGRRGKLSVDVSKTDKDGETTFVPSSEDKVSDLEPAGTGKGETQAVESLVLEDLDVEAFFEVFLEVVHRAEEVVAKVEM